jgi:7-carboxy-7-deazaguanine synthase
MSKLKVAEIFYSLQGEGLYLGTPSIFMRLFGCNFTCAGFGMPKGELSTERLNIDPKKVHLKPTVPPGALTIAPPGPSTEVELAYPTYESLPLVHTGCDSYASWDPRFKHLSPMLTHHEVVAEIEKCLPFNTPRFTKNVHLIITGGEPLLPGWQKALPDVLSQLRDYNELQYITFETNGTQPLTKEFKEYLMYSGFDITFSVSSKLSASGEKFEDAIKPEVIEGYMDVIAIDGTLYFKWVVSSETDRAEVEHAIETYRAGGIKMDHVPVYLMPVGGTAEGYYLNNKRVAEIAMQNGWRYSPRLQVELWKNAWGT